MSQFAWLPPQPWVLETPAPAAARRRARNAVL